VTALGAARAVVAGLVVLLCALFVLWHAARFSAPTALLAGALGVAPWLAIGPSLWRGRRQAVATLLTAPYLGYGLMELLANPGARPWAAALVLSACALFVALIASLRLNRRSAAAPT
jgi:phosphoglycerol transferase MdoB-like AlkP superfamily enzyme